jgi:hypothetical protein
MGAAAGEAGLGPKQLLIVAVNTATIFYSADLGLRERSPSIPSAVPARPKKSTG